MKRGWIAPLRSGNASEIWPVAKRSHGQSNSYRMTILRLLSMFPYGSDIVEKADSAVAIADRTVHETVATERVDVKLVPSAQRSRVTRENLSKRGASPLSHPASLK